MYTYEPSLCYPHTHAGTKGKNEASQKVPEEAWLLAVGPLGLIICPFCLQDTELVLKG